MKVIPWQRPPAHEIPKVPATEREARLDLVLTEREKIDLRKA